MVQRSVRTPGARLDTAAKLARELLSGPAAQVFALLLPCALTGCPLSDNYFVDPNAGLAGSPPHAGGTGRLGGSAGMAGRAGAGANAGAPVVGGNGGSGGAGTGGDTSGTGGTGRGGDTARGGTGANGGSPSAGDAALGGAGPEAGATGLGGDGSCVPEPELCDGISNDCNDAIDEGGVCPEHCSAQQHQGRVYVLCLWALAANGPDYDVAQTRCEGMGTELGLAGAFDLAFVESKAENDFLKEWIASGTSVADGAVWMGANDIKTENTWVWGQGPSALQFFRGYAVGGGMAIMGRFNDFGPGRPNSSNGTDEDCGTFDAEIAWQWNDRECTKSTIGFVCEQQP